MTTNAPECSSPYLSKLSAKYSDHRTLAQLKQAAKELSIVPTGDKRLKATWVEALATRTPAPAPEAVVTPVQPEAPAPEPEVKRDLGLEIIDANERLAAALNEVNKIEVELRKLKAERAAAKVSQNLPPKTPTSTKLDSIFGERIKEKEQFLIIKNELAAIGVKVGKLINSRSDVKGWNLAWSKDKAGLFWTVGNGWEVDSLKPEGELGGQWEGFDLIEHLANNDIDLDDESTAPLAA